MAESWYYELDGKQTGPIDKSTLQILLKTNVISHTTLVWTEGLAEWVPARRIKGLVLDPPPMPAAAEVPPPQPSSVVPKLRFNTAAVGTAPGAVRHQSNLPKHDTRRGYGPAQKARKSSVSLVVALIVSCLLGAGGFYIYRQNAKSVAQAGNAAPKGPGDKKVPASIQKQEPPSTSEDVEPTDPQQKRKWFLERYGRLANSSPKEFLARKELLDSMGSHFESDSSWRLTIKQRRDALRDEMGQVADAIVEAKQKSAMKKIVEFDYQGAMAALDGIPPELSGTDAAMRVYRYKSEVEKIALQQLKTTMDKSAELSSRRDFDGALQAFAKIDGYLHKDISRQIAAVRAEVSDAKKAGLNPSEGRVPELPEHQAFFKSDLYIGLDGMVRLYAKALHAARSGELAEAIKLADVAKYPRSAVLYYARAWVQATEGQTRDAAWSLKQARRLALPGEVMNSRLLSLEASIELSDSHLNVVQEKCDAAIKSDAKSADAYFVKGMMWLFEADYYKNRDAEKFKRGMSNALPNMQKAAELDPDYQRFATMGETASTPDSYKIEGAGANPQMLATVQISGEEGSGSGWCVKCTAAVAYIITNHHVVENQNALSVVYWTETAGKATKKTTRKVKVLKSDALSDLALLEVQTDIPLKSLPMRQTATNTPLPMKVTLIGNPGAGGVTLDFTVISGEISNWNRDVDNIRHLQFNANADHGMSGGPVIDDKGQVVGVIRGGFEAKGQGLAVIAERVRDICKSCGIAVELNK